MVPTRFRSTLPRHLSYPIGAEAITAALAAAPHLDMLELTFYERPFGPASRFQRLLKERLPYPIALAEYRPARKPGLSAAGSMIESGWYDERWTLTVYPVLRELRLPANRLLLEAGLPALCRWMKASESSARGIKIERALLVFDPAKNSLAVTESGEHESSRV